MVSKEEFDEFVNKTINTDEFADKKRKNVTARKISFVGFLICLTGLILFICTFVFYDEVGSSFVASSFLTAGIVLGFVGFPIMLNALIFGNINRDLEKYKKPLVEFLLKDEEFYYNPKGCLARLDFKKAKVCPTYDNLIGEDYLKILVGVSKNGENVYLSISDCFATKIVHTEDGNETVSVYRGICGVVNFPTEFKCKLTINNKYHFKFKEVEKIILEDIAFNKKFNVQTDNLVEAMYILTPTLMLKMKNIYKHFNELGITLDGNQMFISVPHQQLFRLKRNRKGITQSMFYGFYEDINAITEIINEIILNERIFAQ